MARSPWPKKFNRLAIEPFACYKYNLSPRVFIEDGRFKHEVRL